MNGEAVRLRAGSHTLEAVDRGDGIVEVSGASFRVQPAGASRWRIIGANGQIVAHAARARSICWVHADGHVWTFEPAEQARAAALHADDDLAMASPMPAAVREVRVEVGQPVHRDDILLVLEAMKMELPIRAPRDGVVARIGCGVGDLVQPGVRLIDLA